MTETPMVRPYWTKQQEDFHKQEWANYDITVLICQRKTADLIKLCLGSLLRFYPDIPVLVVDGDSRDESSAWLELQAALHSNVKVWNRHNNLGGKHSSHGDTLHDAIFEKITTTYVLMLDSDTIVERGGWIKEMLFDMKARPEVFALGTLMLVSKSNEGCGAPKDENDVLRYGHPSCCLIQRNYYIGLSTDSPFLNHGAPCYKTMIAADDNGYYVDYWPVENYVSHLSGSSWTEPRTVWNNDHNVMVRPMFTFIRDYFDEIGHPEIQQVETLNISLECSDTVILHDDLKTVKITNADYYQRFYVMGEYVCVRPLPESVDNVYDIMRKIIAAGLPDVIEIDRNTYYRRHYWQRHIAIK